MIIFFSIIPTLFNGGTNNAILREGGKCLTYFFFIYILGRYIRLYCDNVNVKRWHLLGFHLLCTALILSLNATCTYLFHQRFVLFRLDYCTLMLFSALSVFYLFKTFSFYSFTINYISSSVLAIYLLSNIFYFFNYRYVKLENYSGNDAFALYLLLLIGVSFLIPLIIDKTFGKFIDLCLKYSLNIMSPMTNKIKSTIASGK